MARFRELHRVVDALRYDGTPDSVAAIAALIPGWISRSLDGADVLVTTENAYGEAKLHTLAPGEWVTVRPLSGRPPAIESGESFDIYYEPITR